jgi:hypothetical protein
MAMMIILTNRSNDAQWSEVLDWKYGIERIKYPVFRVMKSYTVATVASRAHRDTMTVVVTRRRGGVSSCSGASPEAVEGTSSVPM